jgi:hypothetical protein
MHCVCVWRLADLRPDYSSTMQLCCGISAYDPKRTLDGTRQAAGAFKTFESKGVKIHLSGDMVFGSAYFPE